MTKTALAAKQWGLFCHMQCRLRQQACWFTMEENYEQVPYNGVTPFKEGAAIRE